MKVLERRKQNVNITEVKVFFKNNQKAKLKAYVSIVFEDALVIRNLKVIDGSYGLFVVMPSHKTTEACPQCRNKNAVSSRYCSFCGKALLSGQLKKNKKASHEHKEIVSPVADELRTYIQSTVLDVYAEELSKKSYAEGNSFS